eukprot:361250-Chlamydomonas_euryale.AAC.8
MMSRRPAMASLHPAVGDRVYWQLTSQQHGVSCEVPLGSATSSMLATQHAHVGWRFKYGGNTLLRPYHGASSRSRKLQLCVLRDERHAHFLRALAVRPHVLRRSLACPALARRRRLRLRGAADDVPPHEPFGRMRGLTQRRVGVCALKQPAGVQICRPGLESIQLLALARLCRLRTCCAAAH